MHLFIPWAVNLEAKAGMDENGWRNGRERPHEDTWAHQVGLKCVIIFEILYFSVMQ